MQAGRIAQIGTPEDLYDRPASSFVADFIGDANLIAGHVSDGQFVSGDMRLALSGPHGPATVSIRPERIGLAAGGTARVLSASYLGSRTEYVVETGAGELLVSRPISEAAFAPGSAVTVAIAPQNLTRV